MTGTSHVGPVCDSPSQQVVDVFGIPPVLDMTPTRTVLRIELRLQRNLNVEFDAEVGQCQ
jgi:hypothetical protein